MDQTVCKSSVLEQIQFHAVPLLYLYTIFSVMLYVQNCFVCFCSSKQLSLQGRSSASAFMDVILTLHPRPTHTKSNSLDMNHGRELLRIVKRMLKCSCPQMRASGAVAGGRAQFSVRDWQLGVWTCSGEWLYRQHKLNLCGFFLWLFPFSSYFWEFRRMGSRSGRTGK